MPGKKWTTPEQLSFLEAQIPDYLAAQSEGRLTNFYSALTHQFFTRWSERALRFPPTIEGETRTLSRTEELELSPFIIRRKEQIRSWFSWHSKTQLRKKPTLASLQSFGQKTQKTRLMHPSEVYSSLYYDTKIKPRVLKEKGDRDLSRGEHLSLVKSITQEMFAAESAEVKEEVADKLTSMKEIRQKEREEKEDEDNETGSSSSSSERRPEEYQRALRDFVPAFGPVLDDVARETGHIFMLVWAGPDPLAGGAIQVSSMHAGTTEAGSNFAQSHPTFDETFLRPFHSFARLVYPAEARARRALHQPAHEVLAVVDTPQLGNQSERQLALPLRSASTAVVEATSTRSYLSPALSGADFDFPVLPDLYVPDLPTAPNSPQPSTDLHVADIPTAPNSPQPPKKSIAAAGSPFNPTLSPSDTPADATDGDFVLQPPPPPNTLAASTPSITDTPCQSRPKRRPGLRQATGLAPDTSTPSIVDTPCRPRPKPRRASGPTPDLYNSSPVLHSIMEIPPRRPAPPPPKPLPTLKDGPAWLEEAATHLQEVVLAARWKVCITAWLNFEETVGYGESSETSKRLPGDAQGRPHEFSWWMKRARKYSSPPFISDVSTFAASFRVWWGSMRKAGGEDWGVLKTGGPNGFLVIMLLLCWWGRADASHVWKVAVDEATACLDKMSNGKRPSGTALNSPRKSTRSRK